MIAACILVFLPIATTAANSLDRALLDAVSGFDESRIPTGILYDKVLGMSHIEEFDGDTSRGGCTLADVKRHALQVVLTPENSGANQLACDIARNLFSLDGFDSVRKPDFAAGCARVINAVLCETAEA